MSGGIAFTNYGSAAVVTKSDSTVQYYKALYIGGTGNVNVVMEGGETVLFSAIPAGTILPIRVQKVLSTSTTATLIVGLS